MDLNRAAYPGGRHLAPWMGPLKYFLLWLFLVCSKTEKNNSGDIQVSD